ncbi:DUF1240 domain-containing protein [Serratia fonticola]|uniref:DUF1240 domain-containing protein n=1 Tax=Serratia fonticola TaxID=47917 RepID=UPI0028F7204A|nr:DUF1240 domain-containing protein [Serratia fonticola]
MSWVDGFFNTFHALLFICYFQLRGLPTKASNKLFGRLGMLAMIGAVISFFSFYVGYSLKENSYKTCPGKSWNAPTEYVRDMKLC